MNRFFPVVDEPYHRSLRTTSAYLSVVALCGLVLGFVWMGWLPLPKIATTVNLTIFAIVSGLCNFAFRRGFQSLTYRLANFVEYETLMIGFIIELALTRPDNPILWAFYLIQAVMNGLVTGANITGLLAVLLPGLGLGIWSFFWGTPGESYLMAIGTSTVLTTSLYWWIGTNRLQQVGLLEKSLRTENELALARVTLENERKVHARENEWIDALEKTTGALFLFDVTGFCIAARGAALSQAAIVNQHIRPDLRPLIDKADSTGLPVTIFGHRLAEDTREYVDITVLRLPGEDTLKRFAMMMHTATERIRLEVVNKELNNRLLVADKMASLGVLAAGVAHEINNPLTYISGNIEYMLAFPELTEKLRHPLQDVQMGFKQIERIVGDLKNFSHNSRHQEFEAVDLRHVLERTVRLVAPELRQYAQFEWVMTDRPVVVSCQSDRIQQVLLNLIINARQALPERESAANLIRVTLEVEGCWALLHVTDNGTGIPEDALRKVFDPFFTTKAPGVGTGLGLSVSYEIAREHHGQIYVKSSTSLGSTFSLTLPLHASGAVAIPILVIEDEDRSLSLFTKTLRGFDVTSAASITAAIPLLQNPFRAVLCDVRLADGCGFDLYHLAPDALRDKFIFLTALPLNAADTRLLPAHSRLIHKPVQAETLEKTLWAVIHQEENASPI